MTRQTMQHGRSSPSLEMAFQIARGFNVPPDEVFQYPETEQLAARRNRY